MKNKNTFLILIAISLFLPNFANARRVQFNKIEVLEIFEDASGVKYSVFRFQEDARTIRFRAIHSWELRIFNAGISLILSEDESITVATISVEGIPIDSKSRLVEKLLKYFNQTAREKGIVYVETAPLEEMPNHTPYALEVLFRKMEDEGVITVLEFPKNLANQTYIRFKIPTILE